MPRVVPGKGILMSDHNYFLRRAVEELAAADRATGQEARRAHQDLANRYLTLINLQATAS